LHRYLKAAYFYLGICAGKTPQQPVFEAITLPFRPLMRLFKVELAPRQFTGENPQTDGCPNHCRDARRNACECQDEPYRDPKNLLKERSSASHKTSPFPRRINELLFNITKGGDRCHFEKSVSVFPVFTGKGESAARKIQE